MSDNKIRRKIVWEKSGVSEIIGTILMLSITVVLFSSIITFVGSMPAPKQTFVVDLKCSVIPVNGTWDEAEFRILHEGGQVIDGIWVEVYITVDNQIVTRDVDDGLVDANADDRWGVGEWWVITIGNAEATTLSATSDFTVTIVDQEKNMLIWYETIGEGVNNYAPVINRAWIDSDLATPEVDDYGPISYETVFKIYVEIEDSEGIGGALGLNKSDLWVDVSEINSTSPPLQLYDVLDSRDAANDNIYVAYCDGPIGTGPFKVPVGYYFFFFSATDHSNRTSNPFAAMFPVGMIVGEKPQIVVTGDNPVTGKYEGITFSNPEPTNGDTIDITATILNLGGKGANVDVWFYLDFEAPANLINPIPKTILVPEVGQQDAKISWVASPGGLHTIIVNATVRDETAEFYDPDLSDNVNQTEISVMPKILVVDDDSHINDLSDGDTTSYLRASLEAADFKYDFVTVGSGDGPGYDYGDYPLINYDVVIWMTGYRETKTLTDSAIGTMATRTDDVANLRKYLTGSPTGIKVDGLNGGSLWLISEGFWTEASTSPGLNAFASQYLHINPMPLNPPPNSLPAQLYGNETHPVTDYFSDIPINTVEVIPGTGSVHYWSYVDYPGERIALNDSADPKRAYAITYDSDKEPADTIVDSRQLAQTWDFSRIKDTATQAQYTYKAILWLGNITSKFTQDIAISEQTIEPETVFYKQQVTIKFVVRNNGLTNYTIADNLWWLLRIMDMNGNDLILPHLERIYDLGIKSNNTITLSFPWTPQEIGYHRISIKVDPYNYIQESNELNNEISSYWGTGELNVLYRVLVVDDDGSANNGGSCHNETMDLTEALDHLNYDYEIYTVNTTDDGPAFNNVDNLTALNQYNAVIWVVGSAAPPLPAPLTVNDVLNLTQYLDIGGNLWLLGDSLWTAGDETPDAFEMGYLKISSVEGDEGLGTVLLGVEDDDISHGMEYDCNAAPDADAITPTAEGTGFTFMDDTLTQFSSIRFFGLSASTLTYRSAVTSWPLSALGENLSRAEFTFMMLRWFDKPEERIEVRISDIDIWVSDEHPQLGGGYVIQAAVQNTGGSTGNVLVRFMDGTTQIGSDSISVSADGWTTAEIIWVPLFAGERTISIQLDPILEVDEIFPYSTAGWTNNIATRDIYVYFFWDDMESGTGKWSHSSTIMMVNGEGPLEYFGTTAVSVNIEKDWDYALSTNIVNCTDVGFYHTYDKSFWLQEPAGSTTVITSRPPIDVVFALDNSASMSDDDMTNLIQATKNFIGQMTDSDRVAIWTYGDSTYDYPYDQDTAGDIDPYMLEDWEYMTNTNRAIFNGSLDTLDNVIFGTPFYDTLGEAVRTALTMDADASDPTRLEYVIGMTDGDSNDDEAWTPNRNWGTVGYETDYGDDKDKQGLLYAPCMIYTVGLGIAHDDGDGGWIYPTAPDWSHNPPHDGSPAGEYDLWHVADTSPFPTNDDGGVYGENATTLVDNIGHYYYTTDSSQLPTIFEDIFSSIIIGVLEGEDQTRSSPSEPEAMAVTTYTFSGVTAAAGPHDAYWNDMDDSTQAELTAPTLMTEATDAQYLLIANSDNTRWASGDPGNFDEVGWEFRYTILQNPSTITSIDLTYEGQWDQAGSVVTCYAWNQATATWDIVGATMTFTLADTDYTMTRTIAVNPANYINGGTLRVVFYGSQSSELSRCDFASCVVTWTQPPYIMSTTPADGAGDVALTDTIVITFSEAINPITFAWNINPDPSPGLWTAVWGGGNTIVTLSHPTPYTQSTMYTVTVLSGQNMAGVSISPYVLTISTGFESGTLEGWSVNGAGTWSFNIASDRAIGTYSVKGGQSGYTYIYRNDLDLSNSVNTQLTFYTQSINTDNGEDNLEVFISTNDWTSYDVLFSIDGDTVLENAASNWHFYTVDLSAYDFAMDVDIQFEIDCDGDTEFYWIDDIQMWGGGAANPWTFTSFGPPIITSTTPANGAVDVMLNQAVIIDFSKAINTATFTYTCAPSPGGWATVWSNGNTRVTLSHTAFLSLTTYTFTVTQARDLGGNNIVAGGAPNPWSFTTLLDTSPTVTLTSPVNGAVQVLLAENIVITFSEAMNTATFVPGTSFTVSPNPGGLAVVWSVGNTVATVSHNPFAAQTLYTCQVLTTVQDIGGNGIDDGPVPNPWSFRSLDNTNPTIDLTTPSDGSTGVGTGQPVIIEFSEAMDTATVVSAFNSLPNPGGWTFIWNTAKTELTARHYDFDQMTTYTISISAAARDLAGNALVASAMPNPWSFKTGVGGGSGTPGLSPDGENTNKSAVTKAMDLRNLESATLSFWHKYNIVPGANGGVLMLGVYNETASVWQYRYVVPSSAYTGNLRLNVTTRTDDYGTFIQWGWNGISGRGTFSWEKVNLNILPYLSDVNPDWLDQVRVKFQYYQYGGGTGYGWYLDDVRVTVSRPNTDPTATDQDLWHLSAAQAHSGAFSWSNVDPVTGLMKPGLDNYLMSSPIDLTNARNATLSAYVKFNLNYASGAPPDGFRVEITSDNGVTWEAINLGVRSSWNISGTGTDADDGYPGDGKSYTGLNEGNYWVSLGSLTRVNVDLSSFSGNAIHIRFRVVTNSDSAYDHYDTVNADPGFGGFYVDDVMIMGNTILG